MRKRSKAQGCAPPPQVAGLLSKNPWFLLEARWAGQEAPIQRFKLAPREAHHARVFGNERRMQSADSGFYTVGDTLDADVLHARRLVNHQVIGSIGKPLPRTIEISKQRDTTDALGCGQVHRPAVVTHQHIATGQHRRGFPGRELATQIYLGAIPRLRQALSQRTLVDGDKYQSVGFACRQPPTTLLEIELDQGGGHIDS